MSASPLRRLAVALLAALALVLTSGSASTAGADSPLVSTAATAAATENATAQLDSGEAQPADEEDPEPVVVDPATPSREGNTVTVIPTDHVLYDPAPGAHEIPEGGSLVVTAWPAQGYVFPGGLQQQVWIFEFVSPDPVLVEPVAPSREGNTVTVYPTDHVVYDPAPGTYEVLEGETLVVSATPAEGYAFAGDQERVWSFEFVSPDPVLVEPVAPSREGNTVTVYPTDHVVYDPAPGTYEISAGQTLVVTATAGEGYVFADGTTITWEFSYEPAATPPPGDEEPAPSPEPPPIGDYDGGLDVPPAPPGPDSPGDPWQGGTLTPVQPGNDQLPVADLPESSAAEATTPAELPETGMSSTAARIGAISAVVLMLGLVLLAASHRPIRTAAGTVVVPARRTR